MNEKALRFSYSAKGIVNKCSKTRDWEVHYRFYFQLYILERTNHTSLKYILIDKRFTDEIKHRSSGHSFALSWLHKKIPAYTETSPNPNGYISDKNVPPASPKSRGWGHVGTLQFSMFTSYSAVSST